MEVADWGCDQRDFMSGWDVSPRTASAAAGLLRRCKKGKLQLLQAAAGLASQRDCPSTVVTQDIRLSSGC